MVLIAIACACACLALGFYFGRITAHARMSLNDLQTERHELLRSSGPGPVVAPMTDIRRREHRRDFVSAPARAATASPIL